MATFRAIATSQAPIGNLEIPHVLLGGCHTFVHHGRKFRLRLPEIEVVGDFELSPKSSRYAEASSWYPSLGISSAWFAIHRLFIETDVDETLDAPEGLFDVPANAPHFFDDRQQESNYALVERYEDEMWAAFLHWLQVARWVSRQWLLGRRDADQAPEQVGLWFARIRNADNDRPYWIRRTIFKLLGRSQVTAEIWADIQAALSSGATAPLWITFLNEAAERLHIGDLNGCLASCAISVETAARAVYFAAAGSPENTAVGNLMQKVSVASIISKWKDLTGEKAPSAGELHKLFEMRNGLMHSGDLSGLDRAALGKVHGTVQQFVLHADEWYHDKVGRTNFGRSDRVVAHGTTPIEQP